MEEKKDTITDSIFYCLKGLIFALLFLPKELIHALVQLGKGDYDDNAH